MAQKSLVRRRGDIGIIKVEATKYGFSAPDALAKGESYISPNEAGKILNITGEAVKQWIYHRRLPAVKLSNGYWKIRIKDLEDFMKARQDVGYRRIMVIDQAGASTQDLVKAIESLEQEPVVAHNFADALLKAADLLPSLFIINLAVNRTEAWDFIERIRKHRNLRRLPILLISDIELKEKEGALALEAGVQGVLQRPLTPKQIQEEISKILTRVM